MNISNYKRECPLSHEKTIKHMIGVFPTSNFMFLSNILFKFIYVIINMELFIQKVFFSGISRPRISIYPCNVPVANELFSICCKTENIYTAPVTIFRDNIDNVIASVEHPCYVTSGKGLHTWDCRTFEGTKVIRVTTTQNTTASVGLWGCYYYGGMSKYSLTTDEGIEIIINHCYIL